ncbi:SDR family oxidoreductase [Actinocrispum wychmicini]|uniref:Uncharacterized protein YbjT (DUF2867 family) n=1 Tax=Actinocrispum wychmicini TaxID=1213861 RepID=A0A4R2J3K5_9PSEU|nr:NAD(P)H-binding protein [Actinocrispum wychmicini]TCO52594.1 uncharacterized protein YbjT (DUF2867 family) [Actinocrispum wychmicini]
MTKTILVTGGTGKLGSLVVGILRDAGHDVRVASRRSGAGLSTVDWKTGEGLTAAVSGADVIVHCAAAFGDVELDRKLVAAAAEVKVPHLLYISIVGVDKVPFKYYRTKLDAEQVIVRSGVPYTILRTTQFHDLIRVVFAATAKIHLMLVPAFGFQPLDVSEVAERLTALALEGPAGRVPDMGGPQVLSSKEMARMFLKATGRRRLIVPFRLPGKAFRAFRAGHHHTPRHADGRITFAEYLLEHPERTVSYRGKS